ncbi:MAG TPA: hypothetical protein VIM08_15240 [Arthrobacter sp.]
MMALERDSLGCFGAGGAAAGPGSPAGRALSEGKLVADIEFIVSPGRA